MTPTARLALESSEKPAARDAQPVFLSDDSVGLLVRTVVAGDERVMVLDFSDNRLEEMSSSSLSRDATDIFAASERRILLTSRSGATLLSEDLQVRGSIPTGKRLAMGPAARSGTFGLWDARSWTAIRLSPGMAVIREGSGQLMSLSDDVVVIRQDNNIHTENYDGRILGSIPVPANTNGAPIAELAGRGKLWLNFGDVSRIVDFSGKRISTLPKQAGWGIRPGWSTDGNRVLFDRYTRDTPVLERAINSIASVIAPVPESSNGEQIIVVDSDTGDECFRLESHGSLLGSEGAMHADISPSGQFVVVATTSAVSVYRLPDVCRRR
jgi:hypothetical protein